MVWEWSHTPDAYGALHHRLVMHTPVEDLRTIYAEWKANPRGHFHPNRGFSTEPFDERRYDRALAACADWPADVLGEKVFELAERASNCENGGWSAYVCPYLCGIHSLPWGEHQEHECRGPDHDPDEKNYEVWVEFDTGQKTWAIIAATSKKEARQVANAWTVEDWRKQAEEHDEVVQAKEFEVIRVERER